MKHLTSEQLLAEARSLVERERHVTMQLIEWWNDGTALFEATRRGVALAVVLAERDASSGMWAFGDAMRAGFLFVLIYALWPASYNAIAGLIRRLRRRTVSHSPPGA